MEVELKAGRPERCSNKDAAKQLRKISYNEAQR
jgi:hypothetical protein